MYTPGETTRCQGLNCGCGECDDNTDCREGMECALDIGVCVCLDDKILIDGYCCKAQYPIEYFIHSDIVIRQ